MIKIEFHELDTNEWREWRDQCDREQEEHNAKIEAGKKSPVKRRVYKGEDYNIKAEIFLHLDGPFHGKCAYCEQKIYSDQHGDIEHFRPKNAVSTENFEPVKIEIQGQVKDHPGYYWLCYNWRNLLPSCCLCNQKSSQRSGGKLIGKHTRFPVKTFRAVRPGDEEREEPLLLNPVFEDPKDHLKLDSNGLYTRKTKRGKACIDIFGLNDRDLPHDRKTIYKNVLQKMGLLSQALVIDPDSEQTRNLIEEILEYKNGRNEFTSIALKAIRDARDNQELLRSLANDN